MKNEMMNSEINKKSVSRKRLLLAIGYIAAAVAILAVVLAQVLPRKTNAATVETISASESVSESQVTVRRRDVSPNYYADSSTASTAVKEDVKHKNSDFVRVRDYIPDIEVELIYATDRNFTGQVIYDFDDAWLRYGTVKKLAKAQETLKQHGARIKIWDAFRPVSAQFKLWKICPNPVYVSNPNKGYSSHSRGNTVDVTLVGEDGNEFVMPTGFDDFSRRADRNYSDIKDKTAVSNAKLLEKVMSECGFKPYSSEWWHFSDSVSYEAAKDYIPD